MTRVLVVCLGNICRSPAAEAILRARAAARGLALSVDSAGTAGWNRGRPPHAPMIAAAARRGHDLSGLRARQVTAADFAAADLILAMDRENLCALEELRPPGNRTALALYLAFAPGPGPAEVPDPYLTGDFETALDLIEAGAEAVLDHLAQ